jgi:hypothetical protein
MRWAEHVRSTNVGEDECIQDIRRKSRRKETTRKTKSRWVDNIIMDLRAIGWGGMDWTDLTQDMDQWSALVSMEMKLRVP